MVNDAASDIALPSSKYDSSGKRRCLLLLSRNNSDSRQEQKNSSSSSCSSTSSSSSSANINFHATEPPSYLPPADAQEDGKRRRFPTAPPMSLPSCVSVARRGGVDVGGRTPRPSSAQDNSERSGNPNRLRSGLLSPAGVGGSGGGGGGSSCSGVSRGQDIGAVALLLLAASKASPRPSTSEAPAAVGHADGRGMSVCP